MPTGAERLLAFVHPVCALAALAFLAWVASLGLRSRERGGAPLRPRHARRTPGGVAAAPFHLVLGAG